ncbi:MAG: hypothetical protein ACXW6T_19275 [Candidatus Binatia bacterium]
MLHRLDNQPRHGVNDKRKRVSGFPMIVLLIIHGLLAVALLGAITHQAIGVWLPARPGPESFIRRMLSVSTASHVTASRRMGHRGDGLVATGRCQRASGRCGRG